jgi:hypothetical protein
MHYERERLREVETCLLYSSLFFMKPHNSIKAKSHEFEHCLSYLPSAFLHGDLDDEVYMELPRSPPFSSAKGKVCKLKKAL